MTKKKNRRITIGGAITIVFSAVVLAIAIYIMSRGLGIQEGKDFGAGAYYYADIPEFEKYLRWDNFSPSLPYIVYVVLFLVWGFLMYKLWTWVDKRK